MCCSCRVQSLLCAVACRTSQVTHPCLRYASCAQLHISEEAMMCALLTVGAVHVVKLGVGRHVHSSSMPNRCLQTSLRQQMETYRQAKRLIRTRIKVSGALFLLDILSTSLGRCAKTHHDAGSVFPQPDSAERQRHVQNDYM